MVSPNYPIPDLTEKFHCRIEREEIDSNLLDFLSDLNVVCFPPMPGEFFYTPPYGILHSHSDHTEITDIAKLNWMWGGEGSLMDWYQLKPGAALYKNKYLTPVQSAPARAHQKDIIHVFSATIGTPSLVNVGRLHGVRNLDQPRYVSCVIPVWKNNHKRLMWPEAIELFKNYII